MASLSSAGVARQADAPEPARAGEDERRLDQALRPHSLAEFVGQERIKKVLGMSIAAARQRAEALDHVLFSAPPGLGKTSLANIVARDHAALFRLVWFHA